MHQQHQHQQQQQQQEQLTLDACSNDIHVPYLVSTRALNNAYPFSFIYFVFFPFSLHFFCMPRRIVEQFFFSFGSLFFSFSFCSPAMPSFSLSFVCAWLLDYAVCVCALFRMGFLVYLLSGSRDACRTQTTFLQCNIYYVYEYAIFVISLSMSSSSILVPLMLLLV